MPYIFSGILTGGGEILLLAGAVDHEALGLGSVDGLVFWLRALLIVSGGLGVVTARRGGGQAERHHQAEEQSNDFFMLQIFLNSKFIQNIGNVPDPIRLQNIHNLYGTMARKFLQTCDLRNLSDLSWIALSESSRQSKMLTKSPGEGGAAGGGR